MPGTIPTESVNNRYDTMLDKGYEVGIVYLTTPTAGRPAREDCFT